MPRNFTWANYLYVSVRASVAVAEPEACTSLHELLAPLRGRCSWSGAGQIVPIDYMLGLLESALGDHEVAYASFEAALTRCASSGLPRWAIETKTAYANALLAAPGSTDADRARARALAAEARAAASAAGAHRLAMLATKVLERA